MIGIFPATISAGVNFDCACTLTAYCPPDWVVSAVLRGPSSIDLDAVPAGNRHLFTVSATETAKWAPGTYWYSIRATRGGDVVEIEAGEVIVRRDLAAAGDGFDGRDHVRRVLDAIEAVLERRATIDQERYTINNRELWRTPIPELLALRDRYRSEMHRKERARKGQLFNQSVRVRFR